ncbi:MAG: YggS family pyridoxal phosphate-dependent enzyme [Acidobacteriota bacterium]
MKHNAPLSAITENIARVRERMLTACQRAGRTPDQVTLIAVSKTTSLADIVAATDSGIYDFGENRIQEALTKIPAASPQLRWHLIGHLQSNKAKPAVEHFHLIHTVDSLALAQRLNRLAQERQKRQSVLLQVKLGDEATKSGIAPTALPALYAAIRALPNLQVQGLMTIPPFCPDLEAVRPYFRHLRELRDTLRAEFPSDELLELSMGMSHDFEIAIEEGATLIRVGTAIFGPR